MVIQRLLVTLYYLLATFQRTIVTPFTAPHCLLTPLQRHLTPSRRPCTSLHHTLTLLHRSLTPSHCLLTLPHRLVMPYVSLSPFNAYSSTLNAFPLPLLKHLRRHLSPSHRSQMPPHCPLTTPHCPPMPSYGYCLCLFLLMIPGKNEILTKCEIYVFNLPGKLEGWCGTPRA